MGRYDDLEDFALYRFLRALKRTILLLFSFLIILGILVGAFVIYLKSTPLPNADIKQTTLIYSLDGKVIDAVDSGEKRIYVPLSQIPKDLIQATLAIEDRKFYNHFGFDLMRIGGAVIADLKNGAKVQGGSTITQQLAKNLYLTHEKTWQRKLKEALLTVKLELQYSKDQILEMYLNQIYYGQSAYGVQLAASTYFHKNVSELNLAESAMLAGIPKGPTYYSPFQNLEKAKSRQKLVLQAMVHEGYITQQQADEAYHQNLTFANPKERLFASKAPYFTQYIENELIHRYGITEQELHSGGLKIYTTMDLAMQETAEKLLKEKLPKDRPLQTALVSIEPSTGFIKAMVGGRDFRESQYNRVFAKRQPGSAFKPILYLAALEHGVTPLTQQKSEATVFFQENGQNYSVKNFDDKYPNRDIDLHYAITHSDNIYAVKTHLDIGMDKLVEMGKRLGIESRLDPVPSLALGSNLVTPMELTKAYATIANQGKKIEPTAIIKIEDREGNILYEKKEIEETQVITPAEAFVMTYMLEGVFEPGGTAASVAKILKRPVAGKTGTTNDYRDLWLVGYTPQLVTTLWTGYDNDEELKKYQSYRSQESYLTKEIWAEYMEKAHQALAPQLFTVPEGVVSLYIDPQTGKIANDRCPNPRLEVFIQGTEPKEVCDIHKGDQLLDPNKIKESEQESLWKRMKNWWND
ncbi:transglycosylase domain-containing protein [Tepidibacillus fermentans]|uniref:Penicillin-binding protein 1B n=1 Tax=Tepidibacillus fermentans TaxID=1281767 RepID=A0A4R3KFK8_9BACI|nr:penicillin-binding protein 1A [Tepidibacillus fermentans]TCS82087.1 penicillin-binding protein 1B [Tepidibacillus fermentans]